VSEREARLARQLEAVLDRLRVEPTEESDGALTAALQFSDALTAAGLARGLGRDGDEVRQMLGPAAVAALGIFAGRGTQISEVGDLETGEVTQFADTSMANPDTLLQGIYAALAGGHDRAAELLSRLEEEEWHSDQVQASDLLDATAHALQRAAAGDREEATKVTRDALRRWDGATDADDRAFLAQLEALRCWGQGEPIEPALEKVARTHRAATSKRGRGRDHPETLLELPVLGLRALDARG
jgi:hypothetical protein